MKIGIIGVGSIGGAFATSLLAHDIVRPSDLLLIERNDHTCEELRKNLGCFASSVITQVISDISVLVLAVKPQDFSEIAPDLRRFVNPHQIILSMMTGIRLEKLGKMLNSKKIVRCMPNLPFTVGEGITACYEEGGLSDNERTLIEEILAVTGKSFFVSNEDQIDAVTALSASGPGYIAHLMSFFEQAAREHGFDPHTARMLTAQTLKGTAELMVKGSLSPQEIVKRVASPAGTTRAAITYLDEHHVGEELKESINRAAQRAKELGQ